MHSRRRVRYEDTCAQPTRHGTRDLQGASTDAADELTAAFADGIEHPLTAALIDVGRVAARAVRLCSGIPFGNRVMRERTTSGAGRVMRADSKATSFQRVEHALTPQSRPRG